MPGNTKAIRARIRSVDSTRHITKAMELVASSKIRRASQRMEQSRFYRSVMLDAFAGLSAEKSVYARQRERGLKSLYFIVAGDRGLAGGYNNNIFRSAMTMIRPGDYVVPIGKRAVDYFAGRGGTQILTEDFTSVEHFTAADSARAAYLAKDLYDRCEIGSVNLISTKFLSMLSQRPDITYLLPLEVLAENRRSAGTGKAEGEEKEAEKSLFAGVTEYEPSAEAVLAAIIPEYIAGVLYTSVTEAFASELAARRAAMDSATKNADEMLENLSLKYNQARQSAITQEITEIVAGANA
ncbi:MAG: ATP synthase F1 subunit gamma [Clostridia bacterium]|nr:ATP synthase F1 subunit gamma [Clostridia bacterium]